ncbi:MAG: hypothetical protein MUE50_08290 [Pirellulaceae bacterium]|nr:hypothetical protein [Pirellulaceae bacterium]
MELIFWSVVALSCVVALRDWRWGMFTIIAIGLLQDPTRKIVPGAPIIYTVAFTPIYGACILGFFARSQGETNLLRWFPNMRMPAALFSMALFASLLQTFSYGPIAYVPGLIGAFSYFCIVPAILLGFFYPARRAREFERVLLVYCLLTAVMLVGVVLEQAGYKGIVPGLQPMKERAFEFRWTDGYVIRMYSGFFRSSEIMGWHAATLTMLCLYFALRQPRFTLFWLPLVGWGVYCVIVSGRRKMFIALVAYLGALLYAERGKIRPRLVAITVLGALVIVPAILLLVSEEHLAVVRTGFQDAGDRAATTGVTGPLWLWQEVGLFGFGVGTKTQGTQHFELQVKTPLCEGGFEKVFIEVGVVGVCCFLALLIVLGLSVRKCIFRSLRSPDSLSLSAPLGAVLLANVLMFLVSFQIFGDPFILVLLGLFVGVILSDERLLGGYPVGRRDFRRGRRGNPVGGVP